MKISVPYLNRLLASLDQLARMAFDEDQLLHDPLSQISPLYSKSKTAHIICKQDQAVFAGCAWIEQLFNLYKDYAQSNNLAWQIHKQDGDVVIKGDILLTLEGAHQDLLKIERTLLNFLTRTMSIATVTNSYVEKLQDTSIQLLDTRKTIPAFRYLDKYAVLCGGGKNHRLDIKEQVMFKENNQAGLSEAELADMISTAQAQNIPVEIEVTSLTELEKALNYRCDQIMLDNFSPELIEQASNYDKDKSKIEVSGGVTLNNIESYCHPYVDYISVGALTHSVKAVDLSMLIERS